MVAAGGVVGDVAAGGDLVFSGGRERSAAAWPPAGSSCWSQRSEATQSILFVLPELSDLLQDAGVFLMLGVIDGALDCQ